MKKEKRKWYHDSDLESSTVQSFGKEGPPTNDMCNWAGPFNTFTEARKDAIDYHRTDLWTKQIAIGQLRVLKKGDVE